MGTVFANTAEVTAAAGQHLGYSDWLEIDQDRINTFADATGDHQWIHVDPEAAAEGPFGATIAHGYLTLSLASMFLPQVMEVQGVSMGINYGVNKVRFLTPVVVGSRLRAGVELSQVDQIEGGIQAVATITIEIEGSERPAAVIESVSRFID
ncbi:MAG: MaoC family dehydratase [Acidimicrobiales bacterium]|nr:MaoC family dehydratase [Acidimicrobiales bacterium]